MENINFEEAMKRLEQIVAMLERGDIPLDKSLALFEEGAGLVKKCSGILDGAEKQLRILTAGENGELTEKAFEVEE